MVDEGFRLPRALRDAEDVSEEFFNDEKVGLRGECCVEGEYGSGALEAIAREVELAHSMY